MISRRVHGNNLLSSPWDLVLYLLKLETGSALQHSYLIAAMRISKWLCMTTDLERMCVLNSSLKHLRKGPSASHQQFLKTVTKQESLLPDSASDTRALCAELFYGRGSQN